MNIHLVRSSARGWLITCMGRESLAKVMTRFRVMHLLSVNPLIETDDAPLSAFIDLLLRKRMESDPS